MWPSNENPVSGKRYGAEPDRDNRYDGGREVSVCGAYLPIDTLAAIDDLVAASYWARFPTGETVAWGSVVVEANMDEESSNGR